MPTDESRAWERPDGTGEDPRVEILAEGLIAAWPILSEKSKAELRPKLVTLLASLDAVTPAVPRPDEDVAGAFDLKVALITSLGNSGVMLSDDLLEQIVSRTTRLLGRRWDSLLRAVFPEVQR